MKQGILLMNLSRIGRISSKKIKASFGIIQVQWLEFNGIIHYFDSIADKTYCDGAFVLSG